jgi:hypothetical protein
MFNVTARVCRNLEFLRPKYPYAVDINESDLEVVIRPLAHLIYTCI